jgi:hypothetical protein
MIAKQADWENDNDNRTRLLASYIWLAEVVRHQQVTWWLPATQQMHINFPAIFTSRSSVISSHYWL